MARSRSQAYDDKRLGILETAAALFAANGFARTSISMIAKECNASKAWVYHYYESKEAILFDVLDLHLRDLVVVVQRANKITSTPIDRLHALIRALLLAYRHSDDTHKVQINELSLLPGEQQKYLKDMERKIVDIFAQSLAAINPELIERRALLKPATMSLLGTLNWHYTWFREDGQMSLDTYVDLVTEMTVNGVRGLA